MGKKLFKQQKASSGKHRFLLIASGILFVSGAGLAAYIASLDANDFRGKIEQAVLEKTGRSLKLAGPIGWGFSLTSGIALSLSDVSFSNPAWANRPDMAHIGKASLHLALVPLLDKKIYIKSFDLTDADIQLETSSKGASNWDFSAQEKSAAEQPALQPAPSKPAQSFAPVQINIEGAQITDSRLGIREANGKVSVYTIPDLKLSATSKGINLHFSGELSGTKADMDLNGGRLEDFYSKNWPFTLQALYGPFKVETTGSVSQQGKRIALESLSLEAGESNVSGDLQIALGGVRPALSGTLKSTNLNPDDFKMEEEEGSKESNAEAGKAETQAQSETTQRLFSKTPLDLSALKAADADISLTLDKVVMGATIVERAEGRLTLKGGKLLVQPFQATIGGALAHGTLSLDASSPTAQMIASFKTNDMDLAQLFKMGGMESFISGKSNVDISLSSYGQSAYDLAAHANGTIDALMDKGEVSQSIMSEIGSGLLQIFAPGVGSISNPGINCMAARYVITNGLMDTKGLLIDTDMTTIAGKGSVNLPEETMGLSLFTRPKGLGLGSMIPPMQVAGTLSKPKFTLDASSAVQKIAGLLTNGTSGTADESGVPTLVQVAGKNTCAATLDAPQTASPTITPTLLPDSAKNAADVVKETGSKLLKGLFGR